MIRTFLLAGAAALALPAAAQVTPTPTTPETDDILPPQATTGVEATTDPEIATQATHGLDRAPAAGAYTTQQQQRQQPGAAQRPTDPHGAPPAVTGGAGHVQSGAVGQTGPTGIADQPGVTGQPHSRPGVTGTAQAGEIGVAQAGTPHAGVTDTAQVGQARAGAEGQTAVQAQVGTQAQTGIDAQAGVEPGARIETQVHAQTGVRAQAGQWGGYDLSRDLGRLGTADWAMGARAPAGEARTGQAGMGGPLLADVDVDADWDRFDRDRSGGLSPLQFGVWLLEAHGHDVSAALEPPVRHRGISPATQVLNVTHDAFRIADADNDGVVTRDELRRFLEG